MACCNWRQAAQKLLEIVVISVRQHLSNIANSIRSEVSHPELLVIMMVVNSTGKFNSHFSGTVLRENLHFRFWQIFIFAAVFGPETFEVIFWLHYFYLTTAPHQNKRFLDERFIKIRQFSLALLGRIYIWFFMIERKIDISQSECWIACFNLLKAWKSVGWEVIEFDLKEAANQCCFARPKW